MTIAKKNGRGKPGRRSEDVSYGFVLLPEVSARMHSNELPGILRAADRVEKARAALASEEAALASEMERLGPRGGA